MQGLLEGILQHISLMLNFLKHRIDIRARQPIHSTTVHFFFAVLGLCGADLNRVIDALCQLTGDGGCRLAQASKTSAKGVPANNSRFNDFGFSVQSKH